MMEYIAWLGTATFSMTVSQFLTAHSECTKEGTFTMENSAISPLLSESGISETPFQKQH